MNLSICAALFCASLAAVCYILSFLDTPSASQYKQNWIKLWRNRAILASLFGLASLLDLANFNVLSNDSMLLSILPIALHAATASLVLWEFQKDQKKSSVFIAAGLIGIYGTSSILGQSWFPQEKSFGFLPILRDLVIACSIPVVSRTFGLFKRDQFAKNREPLDYVGVAFLASAIFNFLIFQGGFTSSVLPFGCAYIVIDIVQSLQHHILVFRQNTARATLSDPSAGRMLAEQKKMPKGEAWASTSAKKSAHFIFDHDPLANLQDSLPATFCQIRHEEFWRCANTLGGTSQLALNNIDHRFYGAMNPKISFRPCVDALNLMASLFLDANPMVDKRLRLLTALLPILDPDLSHRITPKLFADLAIKHRSFYFLDYGWIEQNLIYGSQQSRYRIHANGIRARIGEILLQREIYADSHPNRVWITSAARERLLQEAPQIVRILESFSINDGRESRNGESPSEQNDVLIFFANFDQLIPSLHRYFDLEASRRKIQEFEMTPLSANTLAALRTQLSEKADIQSLRTLIQAITEIPWRGFREKDEALSILAEAYGHLLGQKNAAALKSSRSEAAASLTEDFRTAVRAIGYPSQLVHESQLEKQLLRTWDRLGPVAQDPKHSRFQEAWMILAAGDTRAIFVKHASDILNLIKNISTHHVLASDEFVQAKSVDTYCVLLKYLSAPEWSVHVAVGVALLEWFERAEAKLDLWTLLLDAVRFTLNWYDEIDSKQAEQFDLAGQRAKLTDAFNKAALYLHTANTISRMDERWSRVNVRLQDLVQMLRVEPIIRGNHGLKQTS